MEALLLHVWDGLSYIDVATSLGSASARRPRRHGPEPSCVGARRPCRRSSRGRGSDEPHRNLRRSSATAAGRAASVLFSPLRARICHRPGRRSSRRPPGRSFPPRTSLRPSDRWRWVWHGVLASGDPDRRPGAVEVPGGWAAQGVGRSQGHAHVRVRPGSRVPLRHANGSPAGRHRVTVPLVRRSTLRRQPSRTARSTRRRRSGSMMTSISTTLPRETVRSLRKITSW